ncbi:MAG: sulfur carrier protein ThiS [Gemmatimonadota bacterium]|nr:sulfur carrier protein ThiS [Gemmatimonadota bacterium]
MPIHVTINGRKLELPEPVRLDVYLVEKGLGGRRLAVAHNSQVVPSDQYADRIINDGDTLEVVRPVGGG